MKPHSLGLTFLSREEDIENMVRKAVETYGKLNAMFRNAGVAVTKPLKDWTQETFDYVTVSNTPRNSIRR